MNFNFSDVETRRFGVRAGRCDDFLADDWGELSAEIAAHDCQLVTIRCDAAELQAAQTIIARGGNLMDTVVTMEAILQDTAVSGFSAADGAVRVASEADASVIDTLAREAFGDYVNHYRADTRLDTQAVTDAMAEWSVSFSPPTIDQAMLLGFDADAVRAFAAMKVSGDTAEGVLHGVSRQGRGRGWYKTLLIAGMRWGYAKGCKRMTVTTQLHNLTTQRTMAGLGMRICDARYTFHLWR